MVARGSPSTSKKLPARILACTTIAVEQGLVGEAKVEHFIHIFLVDPRSRKPVHRSLEDHQIGLDVLCHFFGRVISPLDERFSDGIPLLDKERLCDFHKREVELALGPSWISKEG